MRVMSPAVLVALGTTLGATALAGQAAPIQASPPVLTATAELRLRAAEPLASQASLNRDIEARRPTKRTGEILMIVGGAGILAS